MHLNDAPLAAAALREQMLDFPRAKLYAVLDIAREEAVRQLVQESGADRRRLVSGGLPDALQRLMPVLVSADAESGLLERFLEQGWGDGWGILVSSPLKLEPLCQQLGQQLIYQEHGQHFLLRFYDPTVVRRELAAGAMGRLAGVLAQVGCLAAETTEEPGAWLNLLKGGTLHRLQLRWGTSREQVISSQDKAALEAALLAASEAALAVAAKGGALGDLQGRRLAALASMREGLRTQDERSVLLEVQVAAATQELDADHEEQQHPGHEQEALRAEDQQLEHQILALAEVITRDAMEGVAAYNRLKARGTRLAGKRSRLGKKLEPSNAEQVAELEQLEADLAEVKQSIQVKRREMEQQKATAGEHRQLEQRRTEIQWSLARMTHGADQAAARVEGLEQRRAAMQQERQDLAVHRARMEQALEPDPETEGLAAGLRASLSRLEEQQQDATDTVARVAALEAGLDQARETFNQAVTRFNFAQRLVLGKQAREGGEDPVELYKTRYRELLDLSQTYRASLSAAAVGCQDLLDDARTVEEQVANAAGALTRGMVQLTEPLTLEDQP